MTHEGYTLVRGAMLNPLDTERWWTEADGALIYDAQGRIVWVGAYAQQPFAEHQFRHTLDYRDKLICPGFVDTHLHLPQLPIRGKVGKTLMDWLERYAYPIEERFADVVYAEQLARQFFNLLARNGTTTALVFSSVHEASTHVAFEQARLANLRIIMGKVMMNQHVPEVLCERLDDSIAACQRLADTWHGQNNDLLRVAFTPRFAYSCSMPMLQAAAELHQAYPNSYVHSHLAENQTEIEAVEALYGNTCRYTDIYAEAGCLGERTVMAHGIYLAPEEHALLAGSKTSLAHCPTSNFFLKSGFFPFYDVRSQTIRMGLGTDIGAGPDVSMFRVMRAMDEMQLRHHAFVPPETAWYYATLGGAEALSLADETGNFQSGKAADYIVLDPHRLGLTDMSETVWDTLDVETLASQLMYLGQADVVVQTVVRGKPVYTHPSLQPQDAQLVTVGR